MRWAVLAGGLLLGTALAAAGATRPDQHDPFRLDVGLAVVTRDRLSYYRAAAGLEWAPAPHTVIGLTAPLLVRETGLWTERYDTVADAVSLLRLRLRWPGGMAMVPQQAVCDGPLLRSYNSRLFAESLARTPAGPRAASGAAQCHGVPGECATS